MKCRIASVFSKTRQKKTPRAAKRKTKLKMRRA